MSEFGCSCGGMMVFGDAPPGMMKCVDCGKVGKPRTMDGKTNRELEAEERADRKREYEEEEEEE